MNFYFRCSCTTCNNATRSVCYRRIKCKSAIIAVDKYGAMQKQKYSARWVPFTIDNRQTDRQPAKNKQIKSIDDNSIKNRSKRAAPWDLRFMEMSTTNPVAAYFLTAPRSSISALPQEFILFHALTHRSPPMSAPNKDWWVPLVYGIKNLHNLRNLPSLSAWTWSMSRRDGSYCKSHKPANRQIRIPFSTCTTYYITILHGSPPIPEWMIRSLLILLLLSVGLLRIIPASDSSNEVVSVTHHQSSRTTDRC